MMSPNQIEGSQTPRATLWHGAASHTPLVNVCENEASRAEWVAAHLTTPAREASPVADIGRDEIGRSQTGHMLQRGFALPDPLEDETCRSGACEPVAVREGAGTLQKDPARTATFVASAFALGQALAARTSVAPRQRLSVVTPAHRSGKTRSATIAAAASPGKIPLRTGDAA